MNRRRSLHTIAALAALPMVEGLGCAGASPQVVISDVVAAVEQASIILSQIESQLVAWPGTDAATRAKIQQAIDTARASLDTLVAVGNLVKDVSDSRFQAALADASAALAAVLSLAAQIGVLVHGSAAAAAPPKGTLVIPEPILIKIGAAAKGAKR